MIIGTVCPLNSIFAVAVGTVFHVDVRFLVGPVIQLIIEKFRYTGRTALVGELLEGMDSKHTVSTGDATQGLESSYSMGRVFSPTMGVIPSTPLPGAPLFQN